MRCSRCWVCRSNRHSVTAGSTRSTPTIGRAWRSRWKTARRPTKRSRSNAASCGAASTSGRSASARCRYTATIGSCRDTSRRSKTSPIERENAQAVARLSELADVLDEWILIADPELRLRYANPAARNGLALPELDRARSGAHGRSRSRRSARRAAFGAACVAHHRGAWSGGLTLSAFDGRVIELEATVVAHRSPEGDVAHYSVLARDVTSLRSMRRALDESEARFRLVADAAPDGVQRGMMMLSRAVESTPDLVTFHDAEGKMFYANASARGFFAGGSASAPSDVPALGPDEYLDATPDVLADIVEGLDRDRSVVGRAGGRQHCRAPDARRSRRGREPRRRRRDRVLLRRSHATSPRASAPKAAQRRSETVLRAVVQASPLAIFALDRGRHVHVWNRAAEELFGWPASEVVGGSAPFVTDENRGRDRRSDRTRVPRANGEGLSRPFRRSGRRPGRRRRLDRTAAEQRRRCRDRGRDHRRRQRADPGDASVARERGLVPFAGAALQRHGARSQRRGKHHVREPERGRLRGPRRVDDFAASGRRVLHVRRRRPRDDARHAFERLRADAGDPPNASRSVRPAPTAHGAGSRCRPPTCSTIPRCRASS